MVKRPPTWQGDAVRHDDPAWLAHDRRGSGPPLLLLHGLGSHWQVWLPVLDDVARHRDVIALDLPGFGASPRWPTPAAGGRAPGSVQHLADRVAAFAAGLGLDRFEVAGNSLGGGIALELGRRGLADRVTAFSPIGFWESAGRRWCQLVLGGARAAATGLAPALPRLVATRAGRVALLGPFFGRPGRLSPAVCLESATALAAAPGFAAARAALDRAPRPGRTDVGALASLPVTIAWGTRDAVLPYRTQARRARTLLPTARHVPLPGCGHLPFADDPGACARLLTQRQ